MRRILISLAGLIAVVSSSSSALTPAPYYPAMGYMTMNMTVIVPAKFRDASGFVKGDWAWVSMGNAQLSDRRSGYLNLKTGHTTGYAFGRVDKSDDPFEFGLEAATDPKSGLWGYIDDHGRWVIQPQFGSAERFDASGVARVESWKAGEADYFYVDRTGATVPQPAILLGRFAGERFYAFRIGKLWGIRGADGRILSTPRFDFVYPMNRFGVLIVRVSLARGGYGYGAIDAKGRVVVEPVHKFVSDCRVDGAMDVEDDDEIPVYVDAHGRMIGRGDATIYPDLPEGLHAGFCQAGSVVIVSNDEHDHKEGLANSRGKPLTPISFDYISSFYNGMAIAATGGHPGAEDVRNRSGRVGAIDVHGKWVIPPKFSAISGFGPTGLSQAWETGYLENHPGPSELINRKGEVVGHLREGLCIVWRNHSAYMAFTDEPTHRCQ